MASLLSGRMTRRGFLNGAAKLLAAATLPQQVLQFSARPALADASPLASFQRPKDDNGLGIHLFPHPYVLGADLDPWLQKMVAMNFKWTTTLNEDPDSMVKFAAAGIQPVSRPFLRCNDNWNDRGLVAEFMRAAGVGPYVQPYNEPELIVEWSGGTPNKEAFIWKWIFAADNILHHGGYPGVQVLDPDWLRDLLQTVKRTGKEYIFEKLWFSCHNYANNHPPAYPYDLLNPKKTIEEDWFAMLAPLKFDRVFREEIGRSVPVICTEGGWCIGDSADNRYPRVNYQQHRDFHLAMFDMFRTGIMTNGDPLPDWWFAVTPWLLASQLVQGDMQFEENAWYSNNLSGTKTLTIEAVKALPRFVRQSSWQPTGPRQSAITGRVLQGAPGRAVVLGGRLSASTQTDSQNGFAFTGLPAGTYTVELEGVSGRIEGVNVDGLNSVALTLKLGSPVWTGKIMSNTSKATPQGATSVLRVTVAGQKDLLVKVSVPQGITLTNRTGTKPEYGEFACEFAPLPAATWIVEPEGLGVKLEVPLDGSGMAVVEFRQEAKLEP